MINCSFLFNFLKFGLFSNFEVSLFPQHPTNSCRREMVSMCQRVRQGKLPVGFCTDANSQSRQPKGSVLGKTEKKAHHPIFIGNQWYLVCSGYSNVGNRAKCYRT